MHRRAVLWLLLISMVATACSGDEADSPVEAPEDPSVIEVGSTLSVEIPDEPPPDVAALSFVDNLLAKEGAGEWTRPEGLVATLQVFAGEKAETDILRDPDLVDREATGIVAMARDYLEGEGDDSARAEIERLLDLVTFSGDRLEAMAGTTPVASLASFQPLGQRAQGVELDCGKFFREGVPAGVGQCLEVEELYVLDVMGEGPYRIFKPAPSFPDAGWQEKHYALALEAMEESVTKFSKLEGVREVRMTPVNLVFSVAATGYASADPAAGRECGIVLDTTMQEFTDMSFQQVVAHEMAHCFQTEAFVPQNKVFYEYTRWREEGLAEFLSNAVYPENDLEWDKRRMDKFATTELKRTLLQRSYTNFLFFQHIYNESGYAGIFGLVDSLPTVNGHQPQQDALDGMDGLVETYHGFMKFLTDEALVDSSGIFGDYAMVESNRPTVDVVSPGTAVAAKIMPFGGLRRRLVVPEGKQACFTWDESQLFVEHRPQPDGEWSPLPMLFPVDHEDPNTADLVVTAKEPSDFGLVISSVHDLDEDQDGTLIGNWVVDNASIYRKVADIAPAQQVSISGQIRVSFRDDGTVKMTYDGFAVRGSSEVVMEEGALSTDRSTTYESVTDAEGVDGYEVKSDYIFYDSLTEGGFLQGSETVTRTASGNFLSIRSGDLEVDITMPEGSTEEYDPNGWAILGAANEFNFACGGNLLLLDSVVLRRAG